MGFAAVHILVFLKIDSYHNNFVGKNKKIFKFFFLFYFNFCRERTWTIQP